MPVWVNVFFGTSSYSYAGVLYRYGGRSYSLGGEYAWGRGNFHPVGLRISPKGKWLFVMDYREGEVVRVWRTSGGLEIDGGNRTWAVDLALGRRWRYPMGGRFVAHLSVAIALRVSGFRDSPDFAGDIAESMLGYGLTVKGLGGIYYRLWRGLGVGGNLLLEFSPFLFYRGNGFLWSPLMGETLGGTVSIVWEKLP